MKTTIFVICEIGGHRGRHRGHALHGSVPPARQRLPARHGRRLCPSDADAYIPAAGELKTKPTQHSVRNCRRWAFIPIFCWPRRPRNPGGRAQEAVAVLQRASVPPSSRRSTLHPSRRALAPITRKASTMRFSPPSASSRRRSRSSSLGKRCPTASIRRRAR